MSTLILAITYWLHLLATVVWIGGLAILTLVVWPGITAAGGTDRFASRELFDQIERRFQPMIGVSLVVLVVTGMIQMGDDPHYQGFLAVENNWSVVLLIKHGAVIVMIGITGFIQTFLLPELRRATLVAEHTQNQANDESLRGRLVRLTSLNLAMGVLILLLTAFLTAI